MQQKETRKHLQKSLLGLAITAVFVVGMLFGAVLRSYQDAPVISGQHNEITDLSYNYNITTNTISGFNHQLKTGNSTLLDTTLINWISNNCAYHENYTSANLSKGRFLNATLGCDIPSILDQQLTLACHVTVFNDTVLNATGQCTLVDLHT